MSKQGLWLEDDGKLSAEEQAETCGPDPIMYATDIPADRLIRLRFQNKLKCYNVVELSIYIDGRLNNHASPVELHTQVEFSAIQIRRIFQLALQSLDRRGPDSTEDHITANVISMIRYRVEHEDFLPPAEADMEEEDDDVEWPAPFDQLDLDQWIRDHGTELRNIRRTLMREYGDAIGDVDMRDMVRELFLDVIGAFHTQVDMAQGHDANALAFLRSEEKKLDDAKAMIQSSLSFWDMYDVYYGMTMSRISAIANVSAYDTVRDLVDQMKQGTFNLKLGNVIKVSALQEFLRQTQPNFNWQQTVTELCAGHEFQRFQNGCWMNRRFLSRQSLAGTDLLADSQ